VSERASPVRDTDLALLRALARERSVVAASRAVGISRDRATYRLARLARTFGGPVVSGVRGGRGHGGTTLTPLGDRVARQGFDAVELVGAHPVDPLTRPNRVAGVYHRTPGPWVEAAGGLRLRVAFSGEEGEPAAVLLDPESILVARARFPSSARNVLPGVVRSIARGTGPWATTLRVRCGRVVLRVAVTDEPVRQLRLREGARVWLYVKATALRRVGPVAARPTRGSPRS
jgi:molybdate transport repressor ModE-like protein/molybdopterin-binding protein